jgi:hypothetical protein
VTLYRPSLEKKQLYEYKVSLNIIVKGIEILVLKGFGVVYVKFMVREWCGILVIHKH